MTSDNKQLAKHLWDPRQVMNMDVLRKNTNAEFSDFSSYAILEQISRHHSSWSVRTLCDLQRFVQRMATAMIQRIPLINRLYKQLFSQDYYNSSVHRNLITVCAVPFIHFSTYTIFWEDVEFDPHHSNRDDKTWTARLSAAFHKLWYPPNTRERIIHKIESDLMRFASDQHENDLFHQKGSVIEVLLYYKWKTFIRKRFFLVCVIHLVYYLSFCLGVLFARECFAYTLGTWISGDPLHAALIVLMLITNFFLSVQELLQFLKIGFWRYFKSIYNIIDLASLVMPLVSFWMMIAGNSQLVSILARLQENVHQYLILLTGPSQRYHYNCSLDAWHIEAEAIRFYCKVTESIHFILQTLTHNRELLWKL